MGLFDIFKSNIPTISTAKEALAVGMLDIIAADGVLEESEMACLANVMRGDVPSLKRGLDFWRKATREQCISRVADLLNERQKLCLILNMADTAMSDGDLADAEEAVLMAYLRGFAISEDDVRVMMATLAVKNGVSGLF